MDKSKILVTILAKAHSLGCPGKHVKNLCGRPLVAWSIEQALEWGAKHVVVSTDDLEVRRIALEYPGMLVVEQIPTPTDTTPKVPAIRHAAKDAEVYFKREFPLVVDLDATAPLRTSADIDGCIERLVSGEGWECLLSCTAGVGRSPYFNLLHFRRRVAQYESGEYYIKNRLERVCYTDVHTIQARVLHVDEQYVGG